MKAGGPNKYASNMKKSTKVTKTQCVQLGPIGGRGGTIGGKLRKGGNMWGIKISVLRERIATVNSDGTVKRSRR